MPALTAGGAERVLITLMNNLDRQKFSPEFIVLNDKGPLGTLVEKSIPFHRLGGGGVISSLPRLYKRLRKTRPDIVVSTMAPLNFAVLLLRPFFPRTKFIVREAITPSFLLATKKNLAPLIKFLYRRLYLRADMILSPAQAIIDEFRSFFEFSSEKMFLLRNPVDSRALRELQTPFPAVTEERGKTVHFVCAGRLHPQKGFDRLIEALPRLPSAFSWRLTILGEGGERARLESLIEKHGLNDRVSLPGLSAAPWPLIAAADAFLLPSRWEGLPNVVLESLACGTPVIAMKDAGGIAEIAADTKPGAVRLCDTMDRFIQDMALVSPNPAENFRSSLLPLAYEKDCVMTAFESLLQDVANNASASA